MILLRDVPAIFGWSVAAEERRGLFVCWTDIGVFTFVCSVRVDSCCLQLEGRGSRQTDRQIDRQIDRLTD